MKALSLILLLFSLPAYAGVTLYTVGQVDGNVYSIDGQSGSLTKITPSPVTSVGLNGIAVWNPTRAYVVGNNWCLYQVDLQNGSSHPVALISTNVNPAGINGLGLNGPKTAYTAGYNNGDFYEINLKTGDVQTIYTNPSMADAGPSAIEVLNDTTAYAPGFNDGNIYQINLQTSADTPVVAIPGSSPTDIALLNSSTAYTVGFNNTLNQVNLQEGTFLPIVTITEANTGLTGVALLDSNTAYLVSDSNDQVYVVDIPARQYSVLYDGAIMGIGLSYVSLVLNMPTAGLTGNNLSFANYLNGNAPFDTTALFYFQNDSGHALKRAAPTRNAISTFVAQTTQIALGQSLSYHLHRGHTPLSVSKEKASNRSNTAFFDPKELLVDASEKIKNSSSNSPLTKYSPWLSVLGDFSREKAQNQTPAFSTSAVGLIAGFDFINAFCSRLVGTAIAYAHTHVHDKEGFGSANVDQGYLLFYGSFPAGKWYFDGGLWGGYYHVSNRRKISFPGFFGVAKSTTHGWQLVPHFEVGYDQFEISRSKNFSFGIEPFAAFDWVSDWEHSLSEHGTNGLLDFGQFGRWCSLLRCEEGFRFNERISFCWGMVTFLEKASYVYQKAFGTGTIEAFLSGYTGSFTLTTLTGAQNLGVGEFEVIFTPKSSKYPYGSLSYQGEFGSRYQSHLLNMSIGFNF